MKKILVPTDLSEEADKALHYAKNVAEKLGAEIHFLHVIEPVNALGTGLFPADPGVDSELDLFTLKLISVRTKGLKQRALSSLFIGIDTKMKVEVGSFFNIVKDYVTSEQIDLVIMGSKGATGLEDLLLGSNAERIVRNVPAPVLVVKDENENFAPKKILYPTDAAPGSQDVITILNTLSDAFDAEVHVLHVNTPSNFYTTAASRKLLGDHIESHSIKHASVESINDMSEEEGILDYAAENGIDLIVMASRGRTGVSRLVAGSVATDVVNHSSLPVLVAKLRP